MTEHAAPFYCPYCAGEDLRPVETPRGAWHCAACLRTFLVTLAGVTPPETVLADRGATR